jgi:hypothetical protein
LIAALHGTITWHQRQTQGETRLRTFLITGVLIAASAGAVLEQDVSKGEASFKKCLAWPRHWRQCEEQNRSGA